MESLHKFEQTYLFHYNQLPLAQVLDCYRVLYEFEFHYKSPSMDPMDPNLTILPLKKMSGKNIHEYSMENSLYAFCNLTAA